MRSPAPVAERRTATFLKETIRMDKLRLRGLKFYGRHGTELWEKQNGCRFSVDLELTADFGRAARSDRSESESTQRVARRLRPDPQDFFRIDL